MNSKYDSLDDLIQYVEKYTKEYLEISNIELEMVVPKFIPHLTLYGEMRKYFLSYQGNPTQYF